MLGGDGRACRKHVHMSTLLATEINCCCNDNKLPPYLAPRGFAECDGKLLSVHRLGRMCI